MAGNGRHLRSNHLGQLADATLPLAQFLDNQQPAWMRQGLQDTGLAFEAGLVGCCRILSNTAK